MRILAILILLLTPFAALAQDDDRGRLQAFLEDSLSDAGRTVRIVGFEGALSSQATVDEISVADDEGVWVTLRDVVLSWNRSALLRGRLEIEELSAAELLLPRLPVTVDDGPAPEASGFNGFSLPELPVSIQIETLSIPRAEIGAPLIGQDAVVSLSGTAQLEGGTGSANLSLDRIDGQNGTFSLAGSFENATEALNLDLTLTEGEGGIAVGLIGLPGAPSIAFSVAGTGVLDDFTADIRLATDGETRLSGDVTLTGLTEGTERRLAANATGDLRPILPDEATRDFIGAQAKLAAVTLLRSDGGVTLEQLDLETEALTLSGTLSVAPDGWPEAFALDGQLRPVEGPRLQLPGSELTTTGADITLQFDSARDSEWQGRAVLREAEMSGIAAGQTELVATGTIQRSEGATALSAASGRIQLNVTSLTIPDEGLAQAVGNELAGALSFDYVSGRPLRLTNIDLNGAGTEVTGAITFSGLTDGLQLRTDADLALSIPSLTRFSTLAGRPLTGAAEVALTGWAEPLAGLIDASLTGTTRDLSTQIAQVDPLLAGEGELDARLRRDENGTFLDQFSLGTAHVSLTAEGALQTGESRLDYTFALPNVSLALPQLSGAVSAAGQARQSGETWTVTSRLSAPGETTAELEATSTLTDTLGPITATVAASIGQLSAFSDLAGRRLSGAIELDANGTGNPNDQTFTAHIEATGQNVKAAQAELDTLLRGTTNITADLRSEQAGLVIIDALDLRSDQLRADLTGRLSADNSRVRFDIGMPNLGLLVSALPGPLETTGIVSRDGGPWQIDTSLTGPGGTTATVAGSAAEDFSTMNIGANGTAPLALANRLIAPNIVTGAARFDLRLDGPPQVSSLSGTVNTSGASLALPGQPVGLRGIDASVQIGGGTARVSVDTGLSPSGTASASGPITLSAPFNADLNLTLANVGLQQPGLLETTANGNLTVNGPLQGGALIAGRIDLGETNIRISDALGSASDTLPGLKHVGAPADVQQTRSRAGLTDGDGNSNGKSSGPAYPLDVTVSAPSRIFVRGRGLDAELGGTVLVSGTSNAIAPVGRFDLIRGRMDILGKRLTLVEGFAQLRGGLDPALRLVAETQSGDIVIRILVEGTASRPEISVSSTPDLPQDEVFARLLFGKDLTEITPFQALRIAAAVGTLLGRGGDGIVGSLRKGFGLDDLDVVQNADGTTGVRAGKYLSENIYSDVTTTSEGDTEINLNLDVSPNLTVRGSAGSDGNTGLGIFFEKDY